MGGEIKPNNSKPKFIKDEPYLDSIIEKRVRLFESIKAHQNEALQRIAGETIRYEANPIVSYSHVIWID